MSAQMQVKPAERSERWQFSGSAQVGEWLKPTDCKSVPPSEVRRFESSPVHQVLKLNIKRKFVLAVIAYAVLIALAWRLLSDAPIRLFDSETGIGLRTATLIVVGLFAFRTLMHYWRVRIEEADERSRESRS